jgi:DNA-binding NarL/FixJ family response regulator
MAYAGLVSLADRRAHRGERRVADSHGRRPGAEPVRALVVDDDPKAREAVSAALHAEGDIVVVACAGMDEPVTAAGHDVVVVGHRVPGNAVVPLCERIAGLADAPGIVVVAVWPRPVLLRRVLQAGARGFVGADSAPEVLGAAVRAVAAGHSYLDPELSHLVVEVIAGATKPRPYGLTRAEYEVVTLLPRGLMNREIATELGIKENTVKTHLRHALDKLDVRDRAQAAALVVREGLV